MLNGAYTKAALKRDRNEVSTVVIRHYKIKLNFLEACSFGTMKNCLLFEVEGIKVIPT